MRSAVHMCADGALTKGDRLKFSPRFAHWTAKKEHFPPGSCTGVWQGPEDPVWMRRRLLCRSPGFPETPGGRLAVRARVPGLSRAPSLQDAPSAPRPRLLRAGRCIPVWPRTPRFPRRHNGHTTGPPGTEPNLRLLKTRKPWPLPLASRRPRLGHLIHRRPRLKGGHCLPRVPRPTGIDRRKTGSRG